MATITKRLIKYIAGGKTSEDFVALLGSGLQLCLFQYI